jgi:hypothetical protein
MARYRTKRLLRQDLLLPPKCLAAAVVGLLLRLHGGLECVRVGVIHNRKEGGG